MADGLKRRRIGGLNGRMRLSTVVPAYRQEATIANDIANIERTVKSISADYELIVVVDGFVDGTYQRASSLVSDRIKVLGYRDNGGKGHAIRYGMRHASGDLVAFLDAGMDLDPSGLRKMIEIQAATRADIVIGSKRHPESCVQYPPLRRLYSSVYQALVLLLFDLNVRDTQVGMKLFRREVIDVVEPLLLVKRFAFDIEMLVVAAEMGYNRVIEAPVTLTHGRFPSTIRMRSIVEMLWDTAAVFYRSRILCYYRHRAITQAAEREAAAANDAGAKDMAAV